jgi:hypothetical protein
MRKKISNITISLIVIGLTAGTAYAVTAPDNIKVLVSANHIIYGITSGPALGGYAYNSSNGQFYVVSYGYNKSMRIFAGKTGSVPSYHPYLLSDGDGNSWQAASESSLNRICGSLDVEGGKYNSNDASSAIMNGIILNPAPITVNGYSYGANQIAILSNNTIAATTAVTKRLITWDLRGIWSPTSVLPDNNNAQWDGAAPAGQRLEIEHFGQQYGYGCTNWNDTFRSLMTLGDMANAISVTTGPITSDQVGGRRATFSSDGSKVYFVSMDIRTAKQFTGLWSVTLSTKTVRRMFNDTTSTSVFTTSEPAVVPIGTRNFTGLPYASNLDQVLFNGTNASGNLCGINCIVDNGSSSPSIYKVVDGNSVLGLLEITDPNYAAPDSLPKVWSIIADSAGNVYFYLRGPPSNLYKYDTKGRLLCVASSLQKYVFNLSLGSSSTNVENLRLDIRTIPAPYNPAEQIVQLMSMSTAGKCVAGTNVFKPCDFNHDGQITVADMDFFKTQLNKSDGTLPVIADGNSYLDYIKADLNGNGVLDGNSTVPHTGMVAACVTEKDVEVLWQFVVPGDTNFNNRIDFKDFVALAANFGKTGVKNWSQGDFNFDDTVDVDDLELLAEHWLETYEAAPGDTNFDNRINFEDFAALAANFEKPGVKNWSQGDFNFDGTVDIDDLKLLVEHWLETYE